MESDVITLQDIFVARPPDEERNPGSGHARLLSPLQCTGLKPHFLEKLAAQRRDPAADLLRRGGRRRGAALVLRGNELRRSLPVRRLSLAALVALAFAAPAAGAVQISGLDTSAYPQVRLSVVASQPLSHAPGPDRERARGGRPQGGQPRQRQERRARDRPLAVDGGRLDSQRDRRCEGIRRPEAGSRPDRDRRLRAPCRGADRLLAGERRRRPDPRRHQGRLGVRDRALRRRRLGVRAARQERDRGPRDHPAHRRARRLELGDARRRRRRRPRRPRGHLPDRDRFARLRPCSPPAARAANERHVPPRQLERGAALRVHARSPTSSPGPGSSTT